MKIKYFNQAVGLAGELRVMSELLIRGHNPAKAYLDNGVDIILETGIRIQVKSSIKKSLDGKKKNYAYRFVVLKGNDKKKIDPTLYVDFFIFWAIADNQFWIMPSNIVKDKGLITLSYPNIYKGIYNEYLNNWKILERR